MLSFGCLTLLGDKLFIQKLIELRNNVFREFEKLNYIKDKEALFWDLERAINYNLNLR